MNQGVFKAGSRETQANPNPVNHHHPPANPPFETVSNSLATVALTFPPPNAEILRVFSAEKRVAGRKGRVAMVAPRDNRPNRDLVGCGRLIKNVAKRWEETKNAGGRHRDFRR